MTIRGAVTWPRALGARNDVRVRVSVEDVSRADAAAVLIGETVLDNVGPEDRPNGVLPFTVEVGNLSSRSDYAVRVHLDVDGDGVVSVGDWINATRATVSIATIEIPVIELRRV